MSFDGERILRDSRTQGAIMATSRAHSIFEGSAPVLCAGSSRCLDKFIAYDPVQLDYLIREYDEHYHTERPHQLNGNERLCAGPPTATADSAGEVDCREQLGGVLRHYYRAAAA